MQGTLDTFGVVEILQMLGRVRLSGTLHIECPRRLIDVRFVLGRIAETRDSMRVATGTVIGSQLLKRDLVKEGDLRESLAEQEGRPRPLGTILVEKGFVREHDLHEVLSRQIANTLVAARVETSGDFMFVTDPQAGPADCITVDTHAVLLDISSLGIEYCRAVELLGRADTVLVRNDYYSLPDDPVSMGRDEFALLTQVDGRRTVREIATAGCLQEIAAISILGKLAETGVLLVSPESQTRGEEDSELVAHRDSIWAEISRLLDEPAEQAVGDAPTTLRSRHDEGSPELETLIGSVAPVVEVPLAEEEKIDWSKLSPG